MKIPMKIHLDTDCIPDKVEQTKLVFHYAPNSANYSAMMPSDDEDKDDEET